MISFFKMFKTELIEKNPHAILLAVLLLQLVLQLILLIISLRQYLSS
jgi:hypothetical protein